MRKTALSYETSRVKRCNEHAVISRKQLNCVWKLIRDLSMRSIMWHVKKVLYGFLPVNRVLK